MRIHVHFTVGTNRVDEIVEGETAEAIVTLMRDRMAAQMGVLVGAFLRRMSPLQFAQEATRRYNAAAGTTEPLPKTCDEFIATGVRGGFATRLD